MYRNRHVIRCSEQGLQEMDLVEVESELLEDILDMDRQKKFDVRYITGHS